MCTSYWPGGIEGFDYTYSCGPPDPTPPCDPERVDCGQATCPTSTAYVPPLQEDHDLPQAIIVCLRK